MTMQTAAEGFNATYKFVENFGVNAGTQESDMSCTFSFDSSVTSNGTFTSPNFPGLYPRFTECHYIFYGRADEKVHITFPYFDVEGIRPDCSDATMSDYVEFSDFQDNVDPRAPRLCGLRDATAPTREVVSDSNFFRVTFKSNDLYDATGFEATYNIQEGNRDDVNTLVNYVKIDKILAMPVKPVTPMLPVTYFITSSSHKQ